ncbi:unnamed protein product, partial [Amoebophrya sp. A120]
VTPVTEIRNAQGQLVFNKAVSTLRVRELGITLEGFKNVPLVEPEGAADAIQTKWLQVLVAEVSPVGGLDVSRKLFVEGERLISINEVPAVQLKLREIANMLCAGCDSVVTNASGRVQTPPVRYSSSSLIHGIKLLRLSLRQSFHDLKSLLTTVDQKSTTIAAKRKRMDAERERLALESEQSTEALPFLVSNTERVAELFLKHLMSSELKEAFEIVGKYREETNHPLIEPTGTEFYFFVDHNESFLLKTRKLPKSTKRKYISKSSVQVQKFELCAFDKVNEAVVRDNTELQDKLAEPDGAEFIDPVLLALNFDGKKPAQKMKAIGYYGGTNEGSFAAMLTNRSGNPPRSNRGNNADPLLDGADMDFRDDPVGPQPQYANPVSYELQLSEDDMKIDGKYDIRLDGSLEVDARRDIDPITFEVTETPARSMKKYLLHRLYLEKPYKIPSVNPEQVVAADGGAQQLQEFLPPFQDTMYDLKDLELPLLPRLPANTPPAKKPDFQRRLCILEVPKVVFHASEGPRLFNHVRSLSVRCMAECTKGSLNLSLCLRSPEAHCGFVVEVLGASENFFKPWMAYTTHYQNRIQDLIYTRVSVGLGGPEEQIQEDRASLLPDGREMAVEVRCPTIRHPASIKFPKWSLKTVVNPETSATQSILTIGGEITLHDEDLRKLRNTMLDNDGAKAGEFLGKNAKYERGKILRRYRKRCEEFRRLFAKYLNDGEFEQDFLSAIESAHTAAGGEDPETAKGGVKQIRVTTDAYISDEKIVLRNLGPKIGSKPKHVDIVLDYATTDLLRCACAGDTIEFWAAGK